MISFEAARAKVVEILSARASEPERETLDLAANPESAVGRILAENIVADRNYPPFDRSIRDGFAVRAADVASPGARLRLIGESRAGIAFNGAVSAGECVRILTGAPLPHGANAVVMHEYTREDDNFIIFEQAARPGQYYVLAGAEVRAGEVVVPRGARLGYAELAAAAEVGHRSIEVNCRPRVAILSTGDELVPIGGAPGPFQIRNSNNVSLAAQVALAGGEPVDIGSAKDTLADLRARIEQGLASDMLILSGGVSAGKYDLVEQVLKDLGAEFFFDAVAMRPGKPVVFGWCRGKPVFGLPGNPVSTMVTFELFVIPAIEALSGREPQPLALFKARLSHPVTEKGGVAHFLPARVSWPAGETAEPAVEALLWEGSGDIGAVVRGNCFLVVYPAKLQLQAGERADVVLRRGSL
jgi:molybdopterin molybdotransferase